MRKYAWFRRCNRRNRKMKDKTTRKVKVSKIRDIHEVKAAVGGSKCRIDSDIYKLIRNAKHDN